MTFRINFQQQLDAFSKDGTILSPDGNINEEGYWNFNHWDCDISSLHPRAKQLMDLACKFASVHPEINKKRHYVWFKNIIKSDRNAFDELHISDGRKDIYAIKSNKTQDALV